MLPTWGPGLVWLLHSWGPPVQAHLSPGLEELVFLPPPLWEGLRPELGPALPPPSPHPQLPSVAS